MRTAPLSAIMIAFRHMNVVTARYRGEMLVRIFSGVSGG